MAGIGALAVALLLSQLLRFVYAVLPAFLRDDFGTTEATIARLFGILFGVLLIAQPVAGVALDRWGIRKTVAIPLACLAGGGAFVFAFAGSISGATVAMLLLGLGLSPLLPGALLFIARSRPPIQFGLAASWMLAFSHIGALIFQNGLAMISAELGWRPVMFGFGVGFLLSALGIWASTKLEEQSRTTSGFRGYHELFRIRALLPILVMIAVYDGVQTSLVANWMPFYLAQVFAIDMGVTGRILLSLGLYAIAALFIFGALDRVVGRRKRLIVAGAGFAWIALVWLAVVPASSLLLTVSALIIITLGCGGFGVVVAHGLAFVPSQLLGRAAALLATLASLGMAVLQIGSGVLMGAATREDIASSFSTLFAFHAGALALALALYVVFAKDVPVVAKAEA